MRNILPQLDPLSRIQECHSERHYEEQHDECQIELHLTDAQRRDQAAQRLQGRVSGGVDALTNHQDNASWAPIPGKDLDPVDDESTDQDDEEDEDDVIEEVPDDGHGCDDSARAESETDALRLVEERPFRNPGLLRSRHLDVRR